MAETNYGLLLQKEDTPLAGTYTTIGKVIECGIPKISTAAVETTNHSSGGKAQQIPSGLIALSAFDAALELESASLAAVYADMEDRTIANRSAGNPNGEPAQGRTRAAQSKPPEFFPDYTGSLAPASGLGEPGYISDKRHAGERRGCGQNGLRQLHPHGIP